MNAADGRERMGLAMPHATRLLLIRHGVTDWNETGRLLGRIDIGINARGREQAEALGRALVTVPIDALYMSPQRRTCETAAAIASACGLDAEVEAALDEVWLGARWQGKTFREIAEDPDLQRYIDDPTFGGDVIEPAAAVQQRVAAFVDRVRAERPGATIAMVSHGDPLRLLIARHLSIALPEFRRLVVSPGTVSLLVIGTRGARVSALSWSPGASALRDLLKR